MTGAGWCFQRRPAGSPCRIRRSPNCCANGVLTPFLTAFRSTFRDWCSEAAQAPREVAEACLAHVVRGVEGAYARSDLLDRRRKLMDRWAAYLSSDAGDKVVPMARPSGEAGQ